MLQHFENTTAVAGAKVKLRCDFLNDLSFNLSANIQWRKDFANKSSIVVQVVPVSFCICFINYLQLFQDHNSFKNNRFVYKILNVTHEDEGWYTCIASNSLGQTSFTAYLRVVDRQYSVLSRVSFT